MTEEVLKKFKEYDKLSESHDPIPLTRGIVGKEKWDI